MSDELTQAAPFAAPSLAPADTSFASALTSAPVDTNSVAPVEPVATSVETKIENPADTPTFLETLKSKPAESTSDAPTDPIKDAAAKSETIDAKPTEPTESTEAKPTEPVVEDPPVQYDFKFADVVTPDTEKVAAWTELARAMKASPEQAQQAVDMFNDAAQKFVEHQQQEQMRVWNDTRKSWRTECMADPVIGGNNWNEAQGAIARIRDQFVSDYKPTDPRYAKDMAAFDEFLRVTGGGDHPVLNKFLYRVATAFDEPKTPSTVLKPSPNASKKPASGIYTNK
jgi:hypothetical protein